MFDKMSKQCLCAITLITKVRAHRLREKSNGATCPLFESWERSVIGRQIDTVYVAFQLLKKKTTNGRKDLKRSTVGNELTALDYMLGLQFAILYVKTQFSDTNFFFSQLNNPDPGPAGKNSKRGSNLTF